MSTDWKFPEIAAGDDVLMSRDPTRSDFTYAKVTVVKPNSKAIDVVAFFAGGPVRFEHLWHKDDPRIASESDRFVNSCSGVFVLAEGELTRQALLARMDALEQRFVRLERYVAGESMPVPELELTGAIVASTETEVSLRRPRGRPRRIPLTEAAL